MNIVIEEACRMIASKLEGHETFRARRGLPVILVALALLLGSNALAEDAPLPATSPTPVVETSAEQLEALGTSSPRGAVYQYLIAARSGDYESAGEHLNLRGTAPAVRQLGASELARKLHAVLDRTIWIEWMELSDSPAGARDDELPRATDRIGTIETSEGAVDILVEQASWKDGQPVWKIAAATVGQLPDLYEEYGYGALGDLLPRVFFEVRFLDVQLWQWIGLLLLIVLAVVVSVASTFLVLRLLRPLISRSRVEWDDQLLEQLVGPARLLLAVVLFTPGLYELALAVPVERFAAATQKGLGALGGIWFISRIVDIASQAIEDRLVARGQVLAKSVVPLGRRTAKVLLVGAAALVILQNFGIDVTALVAGLGIGGLAVALAAQRTVENLFGGVTLIADRPVRVGDFCRFGDKVGTVEEVGLRSTRIRTLDRTVITVPNAQFSSIQLENFAKRDRIWFHPTLGVRYETTPDQMRFLLVELKRMLASHPKVHSEPARVRFTSFGDFSLNLEIFAYILTSDYDEYLAIVEDLNLRIMDIVAESGTGFAFPSQTIYTGEDQGVDEASSRSAEEAVKNWRERSELPHPYFRARDLAEMRDKLDYPPAGSIKKE